MSPNCELRISSYLFPFIILASGFSIVSGFPRSSYEESSPAVVTLSNVRRENGPSDDQVYDVTVRAFDEDIPLKLIPARSPFSPDLRVYQSTNEGDVVREVYFDKRDLGSELKFYTDVTRSASLVIEDDGSSLFLEGILNDDYRIVAPKRNLESRDSRDQSMTHMVFRRKRDILANKHSCEGKVAQETTRFANSAVRFEERQNQVYTAEVFLVLDYDTSKYYGFNIQEIIKYYGVFYNAVQRYYDNIVELSIKIVVTSIHLTMSLTQPFLERLDLCEEFNRVDADKSLDLFGGWLYENKKTFGNYDLAMLMTSLDMGRYRPTNGSLNCQWHDTRGIAFLGSACYLDNEIRRISFKSGISEDIPGTYVGIWYHAHEIGHILGCTHDGQPPGLENQPSAETCPWSDGYVMSSEFGTKNKFYFSPCSVSQMKWYIARAGVSDCLLDQPQSTAIYYNTQLPGQIKTLDEQCKAVFGDTQYYYEGVPDDDVCTKLVCRSPGVKDGLYLGPAYEGSPCGLERICLKGVCTNAIGTG